MLRRLSISNFKAFKGLHAINLSPITLICGPNSSGKSSVIQSIMLIKQSLASPGDYGGLVSNGQFVDLGSYKSMVNEHDDTKSIEMVFDFDAPEEVKNSALGFNRMFGNGHARRVSLSYGLFQTELSDDAEAFTYLEKVGFSIFLKKSKSDESQGFFLKSKLLEKNHQIILMHHGSLFLKMKSVNDNFPISLVRGLNFQKMTLVSLRICVMS